MIRTYASPLAFKEALEARLRERAQRDGRSINRVRQLVVMERFLARVFAGFDSAVLKGGMVMELRLERARATSTCGSTDARTRSSTACKRPEGPISSTFSRSKCAPTRRTR